MFPKVLSVGAFTFLALTAMTVAARGDQPADQLPPLQQTTTQQPGTQQPTTQQTPTQQPTPAEQPPPAPPPAAPPQTAGSTGPEIYNPDRGWSIEAFYWLTLAHPDLRGGAAALDYESLNFPGNSKRAPGGMISIPVSKTDVVRVTYFEVKGDGNTTASQALDLFTIPLSAGDYLATQYKLRVVKASFEDLFYPFPGNGAKLRFKTLWEVQYASMSTSIDAPYAPATVDSSGNITYPTATGTLQVILPTLGMAMQYSPSPRFYLELRGSGFGIPHHTDLLDTEGSIAYRIGPVRLIVGGKLYHFKTSPQNTEYISATVSGGYVGLRWTSK